MVTNMVQSRTYPSGWRVKMMVLSILVLIIFLQSNNVSGAAGVKYLYYLGEHRNANWTAAVDKCSENQGELTNDIDIDDWELLFGKSSVFLDDNYFWIGLKRDDAKLWHWLDGSDVNLNTTASFPLRPEFQENITWDCVQWNVKEPFYVPQHCNVAAPFICKLPGFTCDFHTQDNKMLNETISTYTSRDAITAGTSLPAYLSLNVGKTQCQTECAEFNTAGFECWLYEVRSSGDTCKLVVSAGKPVLVNLQSNTDVELFAKYCVEVEKFTHCTEGEADGAHQEPVLYHQEEDQRGRRPPVLSDNGILRHHHDHHHAGRSGAARLHLHVEGLQSHDVQPQLCQRKWRTRPPSAHHAASEPAGRDETQLCVIQLLVDNDIHFTVMNWF